MASIFERAGVAEDLFDAMSIFAGKLRGGVAIQTIAVAVVLAPKDSRPIATLLPPVVFAPNA